jgi:hypothetical protein
MLDSNRTAYGTITNDPEFTKYVRENYIIDDEEICDDDAKGYFLDGCCLLTNRMRSWMSTSSII